MEQHLESICKVLRAARIANDMTTKEAALEVGLAPNALSKLECEYRKTNFAIAKKLCLVYGLTFNEVMQVAKLNFYDYDEETKYQMMLCRVLQILLKKKK